jgi:putative sterol carrier protein
MARHAVAILLAAVAALNAACGCATNPQPADPAASDAEACRAWFRTLPDRFNREAAEGIRAVYQFTIREESGGVQHWTVYVADSRCRVEPGSAPEPDVRLECSCRDWLDLASRRMSGMWAFLSGRLKVRGDQALARHLEPLFWRHP